MNPGFSRRTAVLIAGIFWFAFILFLVTLHPSVAPYRDSGDLAVAAHTLGIAHPPGYPLYVLCGKAFSSALPWGNPAYRLNVMSALAGAAAVAVVGVGIWLLFPTQPLLPLAALFLAASPAFWRLSQVSEMYSLNALFAAAIICGAVYAAGGGNRARIPVVYLLGFIGGAALSNHQTIVLLFPAVAWYLYAAGVYRLADFLRAAVFFVLGCTIYFFLPVRALAQPLVDWGDPGSLQGFLRILTRADYGGMRLHPEQSSFSWTPGLILQHCGVYGKSLVEQFTWPGVAAGVIGIVALGKHRAGIMLLVALVLAGPAFIIVSNLPPHERTTLPILESHLVLANVVFTFFVAAGFSPIVRFFSGKIALLVAVAVAVLMHVGICHYRNQYYAHDYGRNILTTAAPQALIYDPDDATAFIVTYLQTVHHLRPDVRLIAYFRTHWGYERLKQKAPELLPPQEISSGQELARVLLDYNLPRVPVYADLPQKFPAGYRSYPTGILNRLSPGALMPDAQYFYFYRHHGACRLSATHDFFSRQVCSYYAAAHTNTGLGYATYNDYSAADQHYRAALAIDPFLAAAYNNQGTLAYQRREYAAAERLFRRVLADNPQNPSALVNLGLACKAQQKTDAAMELFRSAWDTYQHPDAGNELGLALLNAGQPAKAAQHYEAVLKSATGYAPAYYNYALALKQTSRYAESRRYFQLYMQQVADPVERQSVEDLIRQIP